MLIDIKDHFDIIHHNRHTLYPMHKGNISKVLKIIEKELPKWNAPVVELKGLKFENPFQVLICALLSTRTRDEITKRVCKRFLDKIKTPWDVLQLDLKELEQLIYPSGFYKNKSLFLKDLSRQLIEEFNGEVPSKLEDLLKLKGVGPKVANLVLSEGFNKDAIAVDTHVHRVCNRWGLVKTKSPEETERDLRAILPRRFWRRFNFLLVAFGQSICKPRSPKCELCPVIKFCENFPQSTNLKVPLPKMS